MKNELFSECVPFLFVMLGLVLSGPLADKAGRKFTLQLGAAILILGFFLLIFSWNFQVVLVSRAISGLGDGLSVSCLFLLLGIISSIKLVLDNLNITFGIYYR